jgi:hypothetical protein
VSGVGSTEPPMSGGGGLAGAGAGHADAIVLTIPHERPFHRVAHLVLGGLAVRLNLTVETLEDLQVALDALLEAGDGGEGDVTLELAVGDGVIDAEIGPFDDSIRSAIEPESDTLDLRRVLSTVVDEVTLTDRDGSPWVHLTKAAAAVEAA